MNLYWGDLHAQFKPQWQPEGDWEQTLHRAFKAAGKHLDFFPIVYYPAFFYKTPEGLHVESVGMRPEFEAEWALIKRLAREYNAPGSLVTFPGYEWTGDRTRFGDCNVFFNEDDPSLDLSLPIDELFSNLKRRDAIAIPHHTAYRVTDRGKDWDHHDEALSPVAEIYSCHGSSEGCNTPRPMIRNAQMAPRASGGAIQDALARGIRIGIIASGDNGNGFPGKWGDGLAAVWAPELTRESIWQAIRNRRTYGVTGDRIKLRFGINEGLMGDVIRPADARNLWAEVECSGGLDRIEVIKNNRVAHTLCHSGAWQVPAGTVRAKVPVEVGWGPAGFHGFKIGKHVWTGSLDVEGGEVLSTEGCFTIHGQTITQTSPDTVTFELTTHDRKGHSVTDTSQQTVVFELQAPADAPIRLTADGQTMTFTLAQAMRESALMVFDEQARDTVAEQFGVDPTSVENRDVFYHNAYILKRHMATPRKGYTARLEWEDTAAAEEMDFYYLRVSQLNGQLAWSSPVWVEAT